MAEISDTLPQAADSLRPAAQEDRASRIPRFVAALTSNWLVGALVGVVALGLGLYRIGVPSLWFDEILSVDRARQPLPVIWQIVTHTQPNMALYYFFLHEWLQFTSFLGLHATEAVVRFPSAVFAAGAAIIVFLLARRFLGLSAGLAAAALYIFSDLQLTYTQQTRSYGMQLFLLCLGWYALLAALSSERHARRWLCCYVLAMTLSVYAHFFSLLVLAAQGIAIATLLLFPNPWRERSRRLFVPLLVSLLTILVLVTPMLIASRAGAKTAWIPIPRLRDLLTLFLTFADQSPIYLLTLCAFIAFGLAIALCACSTHGKRLLERALLAKAGESAQLARCQSLLPLGLALLCWLLFPIAASYIVSQKSIHLFLSRYLVTVLPPLFLLVAGGIAVLRWRPLRVVLLLCLALFAVRYVPFYYAHAEVETWKAPALWLEQHYQPGDGLICYNNAQGCQVGFEYYFYAYPSAAHFDPDSPGSFPWVQYDITNHLGDYNQALSTTAIQRYAAQHARLFYIVARLGDTQQATSARAVVSWLDTHYRLLDSIKTPTVTVYLYNTRAGAP